MTRSPGVRGFKSEFRLDWLTGYLGITGVMARSLFDILYHTSVAAFLFTRLYKLYCNIYAGLVSCKKNWGMCGVSGDG